MKTRICIINGPNLNMLGVREPEKYGNESFESYLTRLSELSHEMVFDYFQSNIEGELVTRLQDADSDSDAVIINPAGFSHTSVAIADAIALLRIPVIEVHITNLLSRENFRHESLTGRFCSGSIMGFGLDGYRLAVEAIKNILK